MIRAATGIGGQGMEEADTEEVAEVTGEGEVMEAEEAGMGDGEICYSFRSGQILSITSVAFRAGCIARVDKLLVSFSIMTVILYRQ